MNPGELAISSRRERGKVHPTMNGPGPGGYGCTRPGSERSIRRQEVPGARGRPEASGTDGEQSYEPIVPVRVGNRRAHGDVAATGPIGGKGETR